MFSYRGRQLNINTKLMEIYAEVTYMPLDEGDIDRWIRIDFGFRPSENPDRLKELTDEQIIKCTEESMRIESHMVS